MRILFVSNYYPPSGTGGYEQWCQEVANCLQARGHTLMVLTGRKKEDQRGFDTNQKEDASPVGNTVTVRRSLPLEQEGGMIQTLYRIRFTRKQIDELAVTVTEQAVADFQPDVILCWGMWNVPRVVPATLERLLPERTAYFFCDYWPTLPSGYALRLQEGAANRTARPAKAVLAKTLLPRLARENLPELELRNSICVSRAVRDEMVALGKPLSDAIIVYGGIDLTKFNIERPTEPEDVTNRLRCLYVGRLRSTKGVDTAVEAMIDILNQHPELDVTLDIIGTGVQPYTGMLVQLANQAQGRVHLLGGVPHESMPYHMASYDVLLFPSEWPEPFARTIMEGMAAGLCVVGTNTGGTPELLVHGETGLTFPAGDEKTLALHLVDLAKDPQKRHRLALNGKLRVLRSNSITRMVDELETYMARLEANAPEIGS